MSDNLKNSIRLLLTPFWWRPGSLDSLERSSCETPHRSQWSHPSTASPPSPPVTKSTKTINLRINDFHSILFIKYIMWLFTLGLFYVKKCTVSNFKTRLWTWWRCPVSEMCEGELVSDLWCPWGIVTDLLHLIEEVFYRETTPHWSLLFIFFAGNPLRK